MEEGTFDNQHFEGTIVDFLCEHFCSEKGLHWVFRAAPPVGVASPDEFFSPVGFLPAIVQMAKAAGEQVGFDCNGLKIEPDPEALFGVRAIITMEPKGIIVRLLIDAVERLCGPAQPGRVINHEALYKYLAETDRSSHQELLSCFEE